MAKLFAITLTIMFLTLIIKATHASDEHPKNPASDEYPKNPASDEHPKNPASDEYPKNPASDEHPKNPDEQISAKFAAHDAITISIREIQQTRKFINSIPRLKGVQRTKEMPQLLNCVESLISDLSNIKPTLYQLRHLKSVHVNMANAETLRPSMDHIVKQGKTCSESLKDRVDGVVLAMLNRKLDDLSLIIENVVYHVSVIEKGVYRVDDTKEN